MTGPAAEAAKIDALPADPGPPTVLFVHLQSRRVSRGLMLQKMQHAIPAAPLLFQGLKVLREGAHGFELALGITETVTSLFLLLTIARALRAMRSPAGVHHSHGVDWAHIWSAGVLLAEAGERWHLHHHIARPIILTAIFTLGMGLFHERITARQSRLRHMRIDGHGIAMKRGPFRRWRSSWQELAGVTIDDNEATLRTRAGKATRIGFADLFNAAEVRAALVVARDRLEQHKTRRQV